MADAYCMTAQKESFDTVGNFDFAIWHESDVYVVQSLLPNQTTGEVSASICKVILCFGKDHCFNNLGMVDGPPDTATTNGMREAKIGIKSEASKDTETQKYCILGKCYAGTEVVPVPLCLTDANQDDVCFLTEELSFKDAWIDYGAIIWLNETGYKSFMPLTESTEQGI